MPIALAFVLMLSVVQPQHPKRNANADSQGSEAIPQKAGITFSGVNNCAPYSPKDGANEQNVQQPKRDWLDPTAVFTAILAFVTLAMTVAIFRQLRVSQLAERAWMMGNPEFNPFTGPPPPGSYIVYPASYENVGKSPARLLEAAVSLKTIGSLDNLPRPRPTYIQAEIIKFEDLLLVPNDSFALTAPPVQIDTSQYSAIMQGKLVLYAHGFVKYKDVFGRKHETTFCHYYRIPSANAPTVEGFTRAVEAPPEYNKAT